MGGYTWQLADFLSKALSSDKFMKFKVTEDMAIIQILLSFIYIGNTNVGWLLTFFFINACFGS